MMIKVHMIDIRIHDTPFREATSLIFEMMLS